MKIKSLLAFGIILAIGVNTAWAAWDSTKPAQSDTVSQGMTDVAANFAAIQATGSGQATIGGTNSGTFEFEGSTANDFETTFSVTDPTADNTITFPDAGGNVLLFGNANTKDVNVIFEGATADDFETTLTITDPSADRTVTIPDASLDFTATAPSVVVGTSGSAGSAATFIRTDATLGIVDNTAPSDSTATATSGTAAVAARRDHQHKAVIDSGSYSGNNSAGRTITVDFSPDAVIIIQDTNFTYHIIGVNGSSSDNMYSNGGSEASWTANGTLTTNGFIVGGVNTAANATGDTYYWVAFDSK